MVAPLRPPLPELGRVGALRGRLPDQLVQCCALGAVRAGPQAPFKPPVGLGRCRGESKRETAAWPIETGWTRQLRAPRPHTLHCLAHHTIGAREYQGTHTQRLHAAQPS